MNALCVLTTGGPNPAPYYKAYRDKEAAVLRSVPAKVVFSFQDALRLVEDSPFVYDVVVSTFTSDPILELSHPTWPVEGEYGLYTIARSYMRKLLHANPFSAVIVYSGASDKVSDSALREFGARLQWIRKGGPEKLEEDKTQIRIAILQGLCEYQLTVDESDAFRFIQRTGRSPINLTPNGVFHVAVKPHFSSKRIVYPNEVKEFEYLINKRGVSEREIQLFLEAHPAFLLGTTYKSLRSHVYLRRDEESRGPLIPDFMLEPVNPAGFWKIVDLKLPSDRITRIITDNRKGFTAKILEALQQLREYRDYFENPVYRQRMMTTGITAFKPEVSVIIGRDYGGLSLEEIIKARCDVSGLEVMTYSELLERVRKMSWLLGD